MYPTCKAMIRRIVSSALLTLIIPWAASAQDLGRRPDANSPASVVGKTSEPDGSRADQTRGKAFSPSGILMPDDTVKNARDSIKFDRGEAALDSEKAESPSEQTESSEKTESPASR